MSANVVSYGGGTNSVAMLVGLHAHGERPDAIVFADTGGEKRRTYAHLLIMQRWCESVAFPNIQIVRAGQPQQVKDGSLEGQVRRLKSLPSRAFGYGQCSKEWKITPQEKWASERFGNSYVRLIGFHAGEYHRTQRSIGFCFRYPLIEWGWDEDECSAAIARAKLPKPGKSSCFFCPSTRRRDILRLRVLAPGQMARALEIEQRFIDHDGGGTVKGLGRNFSWKQVLKEHDSQPDLFRNHPEECDSGACFT